MPAISVIVPVYKVEPYLRRCVDRVLAQTFADFELVLVDDGSPDRCGAICDEYAQKDPRVHVIHQKNGGLSAARNAGIDWAFAYSDSLWLAFVDSDDAVSPDFLAHMYNAVNEQQSDLCVCDFQTITPDGRPVHEDLGIPLLSINGSALLRNDIFSSNWRFVIACNKLYKKDLFINLRFPVGYIHEDESVIHRILGAAQNVVCIPEKLYYYYQRAESIMGSGRSIKNTDALAALSDRIRYASKYHYSELYNKSLRSYYLVFQSKHYPMLREQGKSTIYPRRVARATRAILPDLLRLSYWTRREKLELILFSLFPHLQLAASRRRERKNRVSG